MKAIILEDACIGCGACQSIAPDIFELGDDGIAQVTGEIKSSDKDDVIAASESCPTGAISIEE